MSAVCLGVYWRVFFGGGGEKYGPRREGRRAGQRRATSALAAARATASETAQQSCSASAVYVLLLAALRVTRGDGVWRTGQAAAGRPSWGAPRRAVHVAVSHSIVASLAVHAELTKKAGGQLPEVDELGSCQLLSKASFWTLRTSAPSTSQSGRARRPRLPSWQERRARVVAAARAATTTTATRFASMLPAGGDDV